MTVVKTLPNEVLLPEVCGVMNGGEDAILRVLGCSMNPIIDGGRDSVLLRRETVYRPGDIALACLDGGQYVLHRIISIGADDTVVLMGDGNLHGRENCRLDQIHGRAIEVIKPSGRKHSLVSPAALRRARIWFGLLPVRRWLLAFYRHIILKLK